MSEGFCSEADFTMTCRRRGTKVQLHVGIRRRWVVSFLSRPFYPHGNRPGHPIQRRLGGPGFGLDAMEKRLFQNFINQISNIFELINVVTGARGSEVVKALRYRPDGRGLETR
jgi:hypothetical protein